MIAKTTAALLLGVAASASAAGAGQSCFVPSIRAPAMGLSVVSHGSLSASVPASSNAASSRSAGAALCMSASSDKKAPETALSMVKDSVMVKGFVVEDKELARKERVRKMLVEKELAREHARRTMIFEDDDLFSNHIEERRLRIQSDKLAK